MLAEPCPPPLPTLSVLREKVRHIFFSNMLCCGRKKGSRDVRGQHIIGEGSAGVYTNLAHHHHHQPAVNATHFRKAIQPTNVYHSQQLPLRSRMPEMVVQSDFRKVSGITSEVFRQIEAVENDFDSTTAAYFESVEKRGEMVIRLLNPHSLGRAGIDAHRRYANTSGGNTQFVEIIKRPGQTLGLYIREGDGYRCSDGVFISRIALESAIYNSGLLKVGDEVLAVNLVDVRRMSLDDVVIIMSIPRRLVLTIRSHIYSGSQSAIMARKSLSNDYRNPPIVVVKTEVEDETFDDSIHRDTENGHLMQARLKGLPDNIPATAVPLDGHQYRALPPRPGIDDQVLHYNQQPLQLRTSMSGIYENPVQMREDAWNEQQRTGMSRHYGSIVTQQPNLLRRHYPRTADNLWECVYSSGYTSDVPLTSSSRRSGSLGVTRAAIHRPPSNAPQRYWEDYAMAGSIASSDPLRRRRLLRTESDHAIPPTMSDDFLDRYLRPSSRSSVSAGYPSKASMQDLKFRRLDELRNQLTANQAINNMLRRRAYYDGSASDTEASSGPSQYLLRQRSLGSYSRMTRGGGGSRDSFQLRSSSLPRTRPIHSDYQYLRPQTRRPPKQTVRFERPPIGYDEDSDGAVSAPELPANRSRRYGRRTVSPNNYSSNDYQRWMVRAPSTSAIYECVRKGKQIPLSSDSITKIAVSAESLLDTIRSKRTLLADLYASRAAILGKTSQLLPIKRDESNRSLTKTPILSHNIGVDYLRASIPNPTPVKPSDDSRLNLVTLNPREFFKYRPEKPDRGLQSSDGFSGLLNVHLLAGRGLRASTGHVSEHYRDVYCVIECDRIHKARTVVRSGEQSFDWDEVFDLDLFDTKEIAFLLYTWDPQFRHKLCYKGILYLSSLSLNETPAHSLALKLEPRGTLYVKLRYKDLQSTFQRTVISPIGQTANAVFGVDLETVVNRENSGLNVPIIIKRCVDEIEKRGKDLPGIYRLCGSSVRKKMLRDNFERNAWLTDLSPEHMPDINVIASLLKDYIRELPEPLFTKALFDMMDDGVSVCLADDPTGNVKLMFSILECLPKINRCTVLYLMDHLKKIMSHSDRNKMSSQAIAICFGPLFTCHSESENLHKPIEIFKFLLVIWPKRRTSKSGSSDITSVSKGSVVSNQDSSLSLMPSHTISLLSQSNTIATTATTITSSSMVISSHLPPVSIPSTSANMLPPTSALTPGPSPTALTIEETPTTGAIIASTTSSVTTTPFAATTTTTTKLSSATGLSNEPDFGHQVSASSMMTTISKKSVAFAQPNDHKNNNNNGTGSGSGYVSGTGSGQCRALPFPPSNC
ncbi:rho GTPase-activating protein 100F-like isoform X2 [Oppia nitens]|uniref:rho GTPase-activating protein 100F-like isoform X2 n=1 Tax=Oppia nitens TaxID=1686743 RepID=UPI0023DA3C35|nr:rho GTPase-activating protein 100F-like isoform X2 [Oppia nitens]